MTARQPPLQLLEAVGSGSMAQAMAAEAPRGPLPPDAVLDWSVNWLSPERLAVIGNRQQLAIFRGEALLIASDGYKGTSLSKVADLHPAPQAVWAYQGQGPQRFATSLQRGSLPGGALQAVLAQSIRSGHWLTPILPLLPTTITTTLVAGTAWWASRQRFSRRRLLLGLGLASVVYVLMALQLAVGVGLLLPVALPLSAAAAIVGSLARRRIQL